MSRGRHLFPAGFVIGARRWLIASAAIASVFLATAVGIARKPGSAAGAGPRASAAFYEGKECVGVVQYTALPLTLVHESKWDTDTWPRRPPDRIGVGGYPGVWESKGGAFRGCHNDVTYDYTYELRGHPLKGTVDFSVTKPWSGHQGHGCQSPDRYGLRCQLKDVFNTDKYLAIHWELVKSSS
jgi:hypothetical protein